MAQRVFIETTIPSFYYETRRDRRSIDWRSQTRLWMDSLSSEYELVTSELVVAEFLRGPPTKSFHASEFFAPIEVLPTPPRLAEIVRSYVRNRVMPEGEVGDAAHLAFASLHAVDFILTWNCRHLANANKARHIAEINRRLGLSVPIIATPFEVVPE